MPYIKPDARTILNPKIATLGIEIGEIGELNYSITQLILMWLGETPRYSDYNEAIGVLECAKLELYRRAVSVYEREKCEENGDVF